MEHVSSSFICTNCLLYTKQSFKQYFKGLLHIQYYIAADSRVTTVIQLIRTVWYLWQNRVQTLVRGWCETFQNFANKGIFLLHCENPADVAFPNFKILSYYFLSRSPMELKNLHYSHQIWVWKNFQIHALIQVKQNKFVKNFTHQNRNL